MLDCTPLENGLGTLITFYDDDITENVNDEALKLTILADPGFCKKLPPPELINNIDIILLSQSTIQFCGNFIRLLHEFPNLRGIPIFSTLPVSKMAKLSILEFYRSINLIGPILNNKIELNEINNYFNLIKNINYSQTLFLSHINNKQINLSITCYNSGYSIGGSIWNLNFNILNNNNNKILYAPIWNHSKDEFLNSCQVFQNLNLIKNLNNPTTLITNGDYTNFKLSHNLKINSYLNIIKESLRCGLSILLPTSLTGRFFELLIPLILNKSEIIDKYQSQIIMLNYIGLENLSNLSNFLEWMNNNISKIWESDNQNLIPILENNNIQIIKYNDLLNNFQKSSSLINEFNINKPRIYFVDSNSEFFDRFLIDFNKKLQLTLILTEKPLSFNDNTNKSFNKIYKTWCDHVESGIQDSKEAEVIDIEIKNLNCINVKENPLKGKELSNYLNSIKERRNQILEFEKEKQLQKLKLQKAANDDDDNDDDDDDDDDDDGDGSGSLGKDFNNNSNGSNINNNLTNNLNDNRIDSNIKLNINNLEISSLQIEDGKIIKLDDILLLPRDYDVRHLKHKNRLFPMINYKPSIDDYGKLINHEDFQIFDDDRFPILDPTLNINDNDKKRAGDREDEEDETEIGGTGNNNNNNNNNNSNSNSNSSKRNRYKRRGKRNNSNNNNRNNREDLEMRMNTNKTMSLYSFDSTVDPVSRIFENVNIDIRCAITFIDFSGNHDLRSFKYSIKQLKPRKVLILPGFNVDSKRDIDVIMEQINDETEEKILNGKGNKIDDIEYIKMKPLETIKLGNIITSFDLKIDEKLNKFLKWQNLNDGYSISYVDGKVHKLKDWDFVLCNDDNNNDNDTITANNNGNNDNLDKDNEINKDNKYGNDNILIGDIKLTQLRKELIKLGYLVKLMDDGRIVINEEIIVGKESTGQIMIEGGIGKLFYDIRDVVKSMLATI